MKTMCEIGRFSWQLKHKPMYLNIYLSEFQLWPNSASRSLYDAFPKVLLKAEYGNIWLTSQNYDSNQVVHRFLMQKSTFLCLILLS